MEEAPKILTDSPLVGDTCPIGLTRQDLIPGICFTVGAEVRDLAFPPQEYVNELTASFVHLFLSLPIELRRQIYDNVFKDKLPEQLRKSILHESSFTSDKIGLFHRKKGPAKQMDISGRAGRRGMQRGTQYYHSGDGGIVKPLSTNADTTASAHHLEPLRADEYFMFRQFFSRVEDFENTTGSVGLLEDVMNWFWSHMVLDIHFQHPTFGPDCTDNLISSRCFSPSQTLLHARIQHLSLYLRSIRIPEHLPEGKDLSTNVEEEEFITLVDFAAAHLPNLRTVHFSLRLTAPEADYVLCNPLKQVWARKLRNLKVKRVAGLGGFTFDFVVVNSVRRFRHDVVDLQSEETLYRLTRRTFETVRRITKPRCLEYYKGVGERYLEDCPWMQHD